jgi:hypothetical protein
MADHVTTTSPSPGARPAAKFSKTYCSQCGGEFGPGNAGYSHCRDHRKPAATKIPTSVLNSYADLLTRLTKLRPVEIRYTADAADLEERGEHLQSVLNATMLYCAEIVADTVYCAEPGILDGEELINQLHDVASDVCGSLFNASECLREVAQ